MADPKYNSPFEAQFDPNQAQLFIVNQLIRQIHTADVVQVLAVYPTAGKVGFVDVQPMVLDQDTNGFVIAQTPIYKIPYFQLQGGHSAVILAPAVGDIGLAIFAEHDITNVIATQKESAAPTQRVFNTADGLYIGGVLNPDPTQWVKFMAGGGIDIHAQGDLTLSTTGQFKLTATGPATMQAAAWHFSGPITSDDTITAPEVVLPRGGLKDHVHPVTTAPGTTGNYTG